MISETVLQCDELIKASKRILAEANALPDTRESIRFQIEAERMLKFAKEYKRQCLAMHDSYVALLESATR